MRVFLTAALVLLSAVPVATANCVVTFAGDACADATMGAVPSANASITPIIVPGVSVGVESAAVVPVLMLVFEGPNEAIDHWHFLVPTAEGTIVFYEAGIHGVYNGVCTHIPGISACVSNIV